jgi:HEAT repeat protein
VSTPRELSSDLGAAGVAVDDVWQLVNARTDQYPEAVPVLLDWLAHLDERVPAPDRPRLRDGLIRALTVKSARPVAAPLMIELFKRADDPTGFGERWVLGNAIGVVADESHLDELMSLAADRSYGKGRQMLVVGLSRFRDPRVVKLLVDLLGDDDVVGHAAEALGKLKAADARAALEPLLGDRRPVVRREAKKALAKIGAPTQT